MFFYLNKNYVSCPQCYWMLRKGVPLQRAFVQQNPWQSLAKYDPFVRRNIPRNLLLLSFFVSTSFNGKMLELVFRARASSNSNLGHFVRSCGTFFSLVDLCEAIVVAIVCAHDSLLCVLFSNHRVSHLLQKITRLDINTAPEHTGCNSQRTRCCILFCEHFVGQPRSRQNSYKIMSMKKIFVNNG